jgi:hypothetical protein
LVAVPDVSVASAKGQGLPEGAYAGAVRHVRARTMAGRHR